MIHSRWIAAFCLLGVASLQAQDPAPDPPSVATPTPGSTATPLPVATPDAAAGPTASAAAAPTATPKVLYPSTNLSNLIGLSPSNGASTGASALGTTFVVLLVFCGVGFYLLRKHPNFAANFKGGTRKLTISESRSLGNRQFLVVVEYENERMLLGVAPGKIDYLCPLRGPHGEPGAFPPVKEAGE